MHNRVLVVDDEKAIADLIELYLRNENYCVFKFYNGQDALAFMDGESVDLAILDVMLPDVSGFTICQRIREKHNFPVIMLTAKGEEIDKITGLALGADDYITKPFRPLEMVARVKAQLRRFTRYNPRQERPRMHPQRKAALPHPYGVFYPMGTGIQQGTRDQCRRTLPRGVGGEVLHQQQQYSDGAYPPSAREDERFRRASQVHQDGVGGRLQD